LDLLPSDCNEILVVRKDITVLAKGEEEPPYDPRHDAMVEECEVVTDKPALKKSRDYIGESYKSFSNSESDLQAVASNFELIYGEDVEEKIVWKILSETEQINVCPMEDAMADDQASQDGVPSDQSPFFDDIPWDKNPTNVDYNSVLFEKFYPSLKGKAAVLDEYLLHTPTNPDELNTWKL
jgi:hypothetical protein